jgi:GAF domain
MDDKVDRKVRATLFLSEERRKNIRNSGLSLEEFFNRVMDRYEYYSLDKWEEGSFWINQYRVGLFMSETINFCFSQFEDRKLYEAGQEMGRMSRVSLRYEENDVTEQASTQRILDDLNNLFGWGYFTVENDKIVLTNPIFSSPYFIYGFLEGLLKIKLNIVESFSSRIMFDVQKEADTIPQSERALIDLLYKFQLDLEEAKTIEEVAKITVTSISKSIVFNHIGFGVIDDSNFRFLYTLPKNAALPHDWTLSLDETGVTWRMVKIGRTSFEMDNRDMPEETPIEKEIPLIRTELMVPIKTHNKIVAFLHVQSNRLNPFKYREHRLLETMAMYVTNTLYRLESEK